jgi:murein DD-endopeptidase MepM/ murein hydrolase activator NlpD
MRIVRVTLVFFSIGFLVSMIEEAAGRGNPESKPVHVQAAVHGPSLATAGEQVSSIAGDVRSSHSEPAKQPDISLETRETVAAAIELPASMAELRGLAAPKRPLSEPDARHISRIPEHAWMSRGSDPLAAIPDLEIREERALVEFIMPFESGRVTSLFNQGRTHPAIDLAGPLGTPVHATSGRQRVIFTGWRGGYGNTVMAEDAQGRVHLYGHLQKVTTKVGTMLEQGQRLGLLGSTGHSTGPHVHYEVRTKGGGHINPVTLLFPDRKVARGFAWTGSRSVGRVAARADQPRPR